MNPTDHPSNGLPSHLFRYVSSLTPMVNVDLVLACPNRGVLLSWRHDEFYGPGWHVPGGIIRFKESALERLRKVGLQELGCQAFGAPTLLSVCQIMHPTRDVRGHFLSLLFAAQAVEVAAHPAVDANATPWTHGAVAWHRSVPANLISQHDRYRPFLAEALAGRAFAGAVRDNLVTEYAPGA
jgi:colanic acid biosynthesis protein WcaH